MTISTARTLPPQLREIQLQTEELARGYGLDFFETIFEVLDLEELCMFAAYGGFPVRYPHWRFGAEFDAYTARVPLFFPKFVGGNAPAAPTAHESDEAFSWAQYRRNREYRALLGTVGAMGMVWLRMWIRARFGY